MNGRKTNAHKLRKRMELRVARLFGVDIVADWSLLVIFGLIALNLGLGVFPQWHPDWSPGLSWFLALAAAVLFFASITVHELSHVLLARRYGIPTSRITLFIFGGVSHIEREAPSPRAEFWIAAGGPLTSLAIGIVSTYAGLTLASDALGAHADDPRAAVAAMGPVATLLLWLGPVNVLLGLFNLVPGFPLDGGRVLRAALWRLSGDLQDATRKAAMSGKAVGWTLIGLGVLMALGVYLPVVGGGPLSGLWFILIGWFLSSAASASYQQLAVRAALENFRVRDIMRARVVGAEPAISVGTLIRHYVVESDQHAFPVVEEGELVGLVSMTDLERVPRSEWESLTVREVMTPSASLRTVTPDAPAIETLDPLAEHAQVPVTAGGQIVGMVERKGLSRWLALRTATER